MIEKTLVKIIPKQPTPYEKAFGLQPNSAKMRNPTILRNWITFTLKHQILLEERRVYKKNYSTKSLESFISKFNHDCLEEMKTKKIIYDFQGLSSKFENLVTIGNAIANIVNGELIWKDII